MNILNKYCPRSGNPVQEDSLIEYRGYTVGFCNQECRDDFASNVEDCSEDRHYFDTLIKEYELEKQPERAQPKDKSAIKQLLELCQLPHEDLTEDHLEENRGNGFGEILVNYLEDYAKKIGLRELYLLTTTADIYFGKRGYVEIERDEIPENVQQSEEFSTLCPASAVAMRKSL